MMLFFFSRNSAELATYKNFFPTISHRIATLFPSVGERIQTTLSRDQSILSQDLSTQLDRLVLQPLHAQSPPIKNILIIVDGLDECNGKSCSGHGTGFT